MIKPWAGQDFLPHIRTAGLLTSLWVSDLPNGVSNLICNIPGGNTGYTWPLTGSWLIQWIFFSERSHMLDQRIYWCGDVPQTEPASKPVQAKWVFADFSWFGITPMDQGKMAELNLHLPLSFQSWHKKHYSILNHDFTPPHQAVTCCSSPHYEPGQQLSFRIRNHTTDNSS